MTNEEITSTNEESQSADEELETSREELQSLNEELRTVNSRLAQKVAELEIVNDDLSNLLASMDIATIFLDRQFRLKRFTPATKRLLRCANGDVGRQIADLARKFADEKLLSDAEAALNDLSAIEKEIQDDEGRWYVRRISPYRTEDDRIEGVVITFNEITARRRHELALAALNEELERRVKERTAQLAAQQRLVQSVFDATSDGIVAVAADGRTLASNVAAREGFGLPDDAPSLARWVERAGIFRSREDAAVRSADETPLVRALAGEEVRRDESYLRNAVEPDGLWVEINASPMRDDAGEIHGAVAIVRNVDERKRAVQTQAHFAGVMEASAAGVFVVDQDGTIRAWNRSGERLLGFPASEVVGRRLHDLFPPIEQDLVASALWHEDGEFQELETRLRHRDGSVIDVAIAFSPADDEAGRRIGLCGVVQDLRERRRRDRQLAEAAEAERTRLSQELHDSISQQLTGLGLMLGALASRSLEPDAADLVERSKQAAERAKRDVRQINKGLAPVDIDADGLRTALAQLATETAATYRVSCRLIAGSDVSMDNNFIATQLYLIAREAVHNAVNHAHPSEIAIRLADGDGLTLEVIDDGVGLARIATPGLGIRIMRRRTHLIDGTFRIGPAAPRGTAVVCRIPEENLQSRRERDRET